MQECDILQWAGPEAEIRKAYRIDRNAIELLAKDLCISVVVVLLYITWGKFLSQTQLHYLIVSAGFTKSLGELCTFSCIRLSLIIILA